MKFVKWLEVVDVEKIEYGSTFSKVNSINEVAEELLNSN